MPEQTWTTAAGDVVHGTIIRAVGVGGWVVQAAARAACGFFGPTVAPLDCVTDVARQERGATIRIGSAAG
jgi:hypothetical protein